MGPVNNNTNYYGWVGRTLGLEGGTDDEDGGQRWGETPKSNGGEMESDGSNGRECEGREGTQNSRRAAVE